jgi:Stf0 sulphotransferase
MQPEQSYTLWFTQRVGSTLLAQALEDTGVAGRPREWLNAASVAEVMKKHGAATAQELRDQLWRVATTSNGVLGIKYGMVPKLHEHLIDLMASVAGEAAREGSNRSHGAWSAFFPNCRHCFLPRPHRHARHRGCHRKGGPGTFRSARASADRARLGAPRYPRRRPLAERDAPASNRLMNQ